MAEHLVERLRPLGRRVETRKIVEAGTPVRQQPSELSIGRFPPSADGTGAALHSLADRGRPLGERPAG